MEQVEDNIVPCAVFCGDTTTGSRKNKGACGFFLVFFLTCAFSEDEKLSLNLCDLRADFLNLCSWLFLVPARSMSGKPGRRQISMQSGQPQGGPRRLKPEKR